MRPTVKTCFECGNAAEHQHHVVPRSCGGTKTVWLCCKCHALVHDMKRMSHRALTRRALQAKKRKDERVGTIPYGYKLSDDGVRLIADPYQMRVIDWMRRQRERGVVLAEICRALRLAKVKTARGQMTWQCRTVQRIIGADVVLKPMKRHERPPVEPLCID
jgi:hypothetical protein